MMMITLTPCTRERKMMKVSKPLLWLSVLSITYLYPIQTILRKRLIMMLIVKPAINEKGCIFCQFIAFQAFNVLEGAVLI